MKALRKLGEWLSGLGATPTPIPAPKPDPMAISRYLLALAEGVTPDRPADWHIMPPDVVAGAVPRAHKLAMDACAAGSYQFANTLYDQQAAEAYSSLGFLGYPLLAQLSTQSEYLQMCARPAEECTRKWIKLKSASNSDKSERIKVIVHAMKRMKVQELFRDADKWDSQFGRAQLFVRMKDASPEEVQTPLFLDPRKIRQGSLEGFSLVDPMTTYPFHYNALNPMAEDYYKPTSWYVMSQRVHASRLLNFISRPVPPILRPAYNFGGVPLAQMAMPTVNNWLVTRDNVNKIIQNYRTTAFGTDMGDALGGGRGSQMLDRAKLFVLQRDNQGLFLYDKNKEDLKELNTSLAGLDKLQAQAQEHMSAVCNMPLVVLLGITPTGLNASSEGEIAVFYDFIASRQETLHRPNLEHVIKLIQLSELGDIDEDIDFDFVPLKQLDDEAKARIRKSTADADAQYVAMGSVDPEEARKRLANDPDSGYSNLDLSEPIPPPDPELVKAELPKLAAIQGIGDVPPAPAKPGSAWGTGVARG